MEDSGVPDAIEEDAKEVPVQQSRTAFEAYTERKGVCRDFSHLAVAFCRCMNIPAAMQMDSWGT